MDYIVASVGDWNKVIFEEYSNKNKGHWYFCSTPDELNVLLGAKKLLKYGNVDNIIFEIHSNYVNWKNGLINTPIIKLLKKNNFKIYSIRDCHSNIKLRNKIELLNLNNTFLKGPNHGFNLIATREKNLILKKNIILSNKNYSPKYLFYKSSKKFHYI